MRINAKNISIPKSVSIMGIEYEVMQVDDLRREDYAKLDGHIRFTDTSISLEKSLNPQAKLQTFAHEIIHGILTQIGRPDALDDSEVDALAYGIIGMIQATEWDSGGYPETSRNL